VLRRAKLEVTIVSVTGRLLVTGSHSIAIQADTLFEKTNFAYGTMLILPGGMPGAKNLQSHKGLEEILRIYARDKKYIAAICAAPKVLGHFDILNNRNATCYPGFENELIGATFLNLPVVQDGNIITSKGPGFAIDFGLKIVAVLKGEEYAEKVANDMLVP